MSETASPNPRNRSYQTLPRVLQFRDLVLLTLGSVIGSGIFIVPATVLRLTGGELGPALLIWIAGGVLSILGALTYAELAAMKPESGGLYVYLRDAFGGFVAFLYGWALFFVISSASVATLAVAFAGYLGQLVPLSGWGAKTVAVGMVIVIAVINVVGTRRSANVQNWTTALKVGAILVMSVLLLAGGNELAGVRLVPVSMELSLLVGMGAAMIGVLWAYEGWTYVTFSAGEALDPQRSFPRAIVVGTAALAGIYLLANVAYVAALGPERSAQSERIAAEAVAAILGPGAGKLIALAILISMFSAANAVVLTVSRVYFAMARDGVFFQKMAEIHPRWNTPALAIVASSAWAAIMAATGTFDELLTYVVFTGWIFYGLGAASIFYYRRRQPEAIRPFRTPGFPWTPILFILAAGAIVLNTFLVHPGRALVGIALVLLGAPAFWFWRRKQRVMTLAPKLSIAALLCAAAPTFFLAEPAPASGADDLSAAQRANGVAALADAFVALAVSHDPTIAYSTGLEAPDHGRFADRTPKAIRAFQRREDALLARLERIPAASVSLVDQPTYAVLREMLESSRQLRVCRTEYWDVSHFTGWQAAFPLIAQQQPIGSAALRSQALARWRSLPRYLETQKSNLSAGLRAGYSAPKAVVRRVIRQLDGLQVRPEDSPFYSPAARETGEAFRKEFRAVVAQRILPAIREYRDFLADEYLPHARDSIGIDALPLGEQCYRAQLRGYITLARNPTEVYELGERTVAQNTAAVVEIGSRLYGASEFEAIVNANNAAPANRFSSADEYLSYSNDLLKRAADLLHLLFLKLPDQAVVIEPVPAYQAGSGVSASYEMQPDASQPAKYLTPIENWKSETRGSAEVTLVHETLPGHHLQIAMARELSQHSQLSKLASNGAYIEGWARYAERLAEEAGVYRTDYARISRRAWPARGMVVDPGIHAFGWTRERAVAYLKSTGHFDDQTADDMVDRIAALPGQLTAYDSGGLEFFALHKEAQAALGASFDIRRFHRAVLEQGSVPLQELRDHVHEWIAAERASAAQ